VISVFFAFPLFALPSEEHISASVPGLQKGPLKQVPDIVKKAVSKRQVPGAVILIGDREDVIYRSAFGDRALRPKRLPMKADTIFDIASLTKVVATTTAVMQLADAGKLNVADPVVKYWPEFGANGKADITISHLLTHYSGLVADLPLSPAWSGYDTALNKIIAEKPLYPPATHFIYSDINFEILGELVRRISGQPLDQYCNEHIFRPLGMKDTFFKPSSSLRNRIAPTEYLNKRKGNLLWGEVHDPTAIRTGGVAGHAGLFSTADDLAVFARTLLNGGGFNGVRILNTQTVENMTIPQSPPGEIPLRGYGWNIDSPFSSNRWELSPVGSYYHTGFTGTAMWIDPVSGIYIIVLTNRVHPYGKGDAGPLRRQIIELVAEALGPLSEGNILVKRPLLSGYYSKNGKVQTGIDVLRAEKLAPLSNMRIGLITNHSGIDSTGRRTIDRLYNAKGIKLAAIFSPEHGLQGEADNKVASAAEPATGLPVYSLYGENLRPTKKMLKGLDALVFDIQDAGARFYTYITTMGYAMEAAAKEGIAFYVLDRPNPVTGAIVQGPVMNMDMKSFTGYFPLPARHGMTVGELAEMFNAELNIGVKLHVIKMNGYRRADWFDETGLPWINPSPNLRSLTETVLYSGVAMAEGANVSVGRGTNTPFELLGAPWINADELSAYLNARNIQGVKFAPAGFTPAGSIFKNDLCHGVKIILTDRQTLDSAALGIEIISALYKLYPKDFRLDKTLGLIGSRNVLQEIRDGLDPKIIGLNWQGPLAQFLKLRSKYLLYQ